MRALTLRQPYASAIVEGPKRVENRPWPVPSTVPLPAIIAVHAGAAAWPTAPVRQLWPDCPPAAQLPRRAILGAMRVVRVSNHHRGQDPALRSPWATGPYCWVIDRVWTLPAPLPVLRGHLGLWHLAKVSPEAAEVLLRLVEASP